MLNPNQVSLFENDGYLVVPDILTSQECDRYMTIFHEYADADFSALMNMHWEIPEAKKFACYPHIVEMIEQLQRSEVDLIQSQFLFKQAGSRYAKQAWEPHQDNSYPQCPYGTYITINVFLANSDPGNGGMYIYPGSHKEPLLDFVPTPSYREAGNNPGNRVAIPSKYLKKDLYIDKGAMLILNSHVIHGSYPNNSPDRSRPLFSVSYLSKGATFLVGKNAKRRLMPVR